jgi:hypothetical protein
MRSGFALPVQPPAAISASSQEQYGNRGESVGRASIFAAIAVAATAAAGCSSAAASHAAVAAPASPACPAAQAAVRTVEQQAAAGNLTMTETNGWATLLDTAGRDANRYNNGPGAARQLAVSLVSAQGAAVTLGLDVADGSSSESAEQAQLMNDLRSAAADCGA